jgi:hypothetical protein
VMNGWIIRSSQHHWWWLGVWKSHEITPCFFLHPGCWFLYIFVHQILVSYFSSISLFIHDVIAFHAGTSDTDPQLASASHWWPVAGLRNTRPLVLTPSWQKSFSTIWVWINTYFFTIFSGMNIHKSQLFWCELQGYKVLTHCHMYGEVNINLQAISMWLQGWRAARELRKTLAKLPELRCLCCLWWGVEAAKSGILRNIG